VARLPSREGPGGGSTGLGFTSGGVDFGFDKSSSSAVAFDHGQVAILYPVREGDLSGAGTSATDRLLAQQSPLSLSSVCCRLTGAAALTASLVCLPYVAGKAIIVERGELALCQGIDGSVRMIGPGLHFTETLFTTVKKFKENTNQIQLGPLSILRILPGTVGLGSMNGRPVLLLAGRHVVNDPLFAFLGTQLLTQPLIRNGTIHIITVPADQLALVSVQGVGHILEPGRHEIDNPLFQFHEFVKARQEYICVKSKHRVTVPAGRVGLAREKGVPQILDSGRTIFIDSPMFEYVKSVPLSEELIRHGSIKIVMVKEGKLGVSFDDGVLAILGPGRHVIRKATHTFSGFLNTGQQTLSIGEVSLMSSDNVGLRFDAAITVQVVDGKKAVAVLAQGLGENYAQSRFDDAVKLKGKLALSIIVGNNRLQNTFSAATHRGEDGELLDGAGVGADEVQGAASSFKQHVHDQFMSKFAASMREECGVRVVDMAIEDIKIINEELAQAMSRGAVTATELDMAKIERDVLTMKAQTEQQAEIIRANGQASAIAIMAEAEASRIRTLDEALAGVSDVSKQRELVRASGSVLREAKATVLLAPSVQGIGSILGPTGLGAAVPGGILAQ
jgi:regulator of protease activity HflC (stomatin/prohibitin superfamily)